MDLVLILRTKVPELEKTFCTSFLKLKWFKYSKSSNYAACGLGCLLTRCIVLFTFVCINILCTCRPQVAPAGWTATLVQYYGIGERSINPVGILVIDSVEVFGFRMHASRFSVRMILCMVLLPH